MNTQTPRGIKPYYIGLLAVAAFTVIMLLVVLVQGISGRQDVTTASKAAEIADKLNDYTNTNSKVPNSLADISEKNVPSTISYKKISASSYKFCATYKSGTDDLNVSGVESGITQLESGSAVQDPSLDSSRSTDNSYLDVSTHHKGQNCQTISIYNYAVPDNSGDGSDSSGSNTSDPCTYPGDSSSDQAFQQYEDCENNYYSGSTNTDNTTTPATPTTKT